MASYLVMLEGGPIQLPTGELQTDGTASQVGFFTTRKATADTAANAATLAIDGALAELRENLLREDAKSPPISVVRIRKVTWFETLSRQYRGFTFFPWKEP